jgi:hypothetical protein
MRRHRVEQRLLLGLDRWVKGSLYRLCRGLAVNDTRPG